MKTLKQLLKRLYYYGTVFADERHPKPTNNERDDFRRGLKWAMNK